MTFDQASEVIWGLVMIVIGGLIWAVRLEGRVNLLGARMDDWMKERREVMQQVITHLERMERKVDQIRLRCAAFGHLHGIGDVGPPDEEKPS